MPGRQNIQWKLVLLVTLAGAGSSTTVWGQTAYNRWEAKPAPVPAVVPAERRGAKLMQTKVQRDSIEGTTYWDSVPPLKRGLGLRIEDKRLLPADSTYFNFISRSMKYPVEALRAETQGIIWLRLSVNITGRIAGITLAESTIPPGAGGEAAILQQARQMLRQVRFEPAAIATEEKVKLTYKFE